MKIKEIKDKKLRELALLRCDDDEGIDSRLTNAFLWSTTPEGQDFWVDVSKGSITKLDDEVLDKETVNDLIIEEMHGMRDEFLQKNEDYNNSLHKPNLFGQEPIEGLKARISDKLNRILSKGLDDKTEDSFKDLFGYYIHYRIMKNNV